MSFARHPKDFWAGIVFIAFGLAAVFIASDYPIGTAARMGPGYFPRGLGYLLAILGVALSLRALKIQGDAIARWKLRPTLVVLLSVVVFGIIVDRVGVAISTMALIVAASAASREFKLRESLVSGLVLAAMAVGGFVLALKLQLPIWPSMR